MPTQSATDLAQLSINTIRGLAMDAVQAAKSGHPGMPMGAAPMAYALYRDHLRFDPEAPDWFNRDRFILSAGHGSMLLYALLHLTGYDLPLEELKRFRQLGSQTPGHPENCLTVGVEMATGPLGQGFATGVGMAIAEEKLRHEFPALVDHHTYAICSDGDLMEGVSHEAASLAGHLRLERLIYLYDSNEVTIDGPTALSYTDDVRRRFEGYGWHVLECDGMAEEEVSTRIAEAKTIPAFPKLIICRTIIGYGSPNKAGKSSSHGAPLGDDEVKLSKHALGIPEEPSFFVPDTVAEHMREIGVKHRKERIESEAAAAADGELTRRIKRELPKDWRDSFPLLEGAMATRAASGKVINALASRLPELVGGSADLAESNCTLIHDSGPFGGANRSGRNLYYGVREHAMGCAINGINLHGGFRAFGGTFLIFSDYMRPSIRLAALMKTPTVFVFSHDSIGLGEDGPTHQPIEHLASLRAMPNLWVFRPADAAETVASWRLALERTEGPSAIVLTRQAVHPLGVESPQVEKGAYVVRDAKSAPDIVLIGTGSEVGLCIEAYERLSRDGVAARVVSMPCWEAFAAQPTSYRDAVLPKAAKSRVSVEAGATLGWSTWIGDEGVAIGIDRFGESAPYQQVYEHLGMTAERIVERSLELLRGR